MADLDKWQKKKNTPVTDLRKNPKEGLGKLFKFLETRKEHLKKENIEELAAQNIYYIDWLVLIGRWAVIVFLALYGIHRFSSSVFIDLSGFANPAWKYFFFLLLWALLNAVYHNIKGPKNRNAALIRIGCDIGFSLLIVHYTGGSQSFCFALFALISIEAALQLRGALLPLSVAAVSTLLFGILLAGEAAGVVEHFPVLIFEAYSPLFNLFLFLFSAILNLAGVVVVSHFTEESREYSRSSCQGNDRDLLTDTYTRAAFFKLLKSEIDRCSRVNQALSIILLGIDNMEEYNRKFGYQAGDQLLTMVGDIIKKNTRSSFKKEGRAQDIVCRYSGDIFSIIFPEVKPAYDVEEMRRLKEQTHSRRVFQLAQRLQGKIGEVAGVNGPVQISAGGGHWPYHGNTPDELVSEAFRALAEAKSQGKNQIVVAKKGV
jgi:diguanylate cyclase (GGDEF)-like protein